MEVPSDYIIEIIRKTLDDRIDSVENNLKCEILSLKAEIKEYNNKCDIEMNLHEKRIRATEDFDLKIIAISGAIGALSAVLISITLKLLS